jgi:hypothetical protein
MQRSERASKYDIISFIIGENLNINTHRTATGVATNKSYFLS